MASQHLHAGVADAVGGVAVHADAGLGTGGAESGMARDILRCGDASDALLGLFAVCDDLVAPGHEDHLPRPEGHRGDAVSDHVEPVERSLLRDGIHSRDEEIRHQGPAAYFEPFGAGHRGVEPVEEREPGVFPEPLDDSGRPHRHRVSERYDFRRGGLHGGPDDVKRLGGVAHGLDIEMVAAQGGCAGKDLFSVHGR